MEIKSRSGQIAPGSTIVDMANLKKKSDMINAQGDKIDPVTKQVIKRREKDEDEK